MAEMFVRSADVEALLRRSIANQIKTNLKFCFAIRLGKVPYIGKCRNIDQYNKALQCRLSQDAEITICFYDGNGNSNTQYVIYPTLEQLEQGKKLEEQAQSSKEQKTLNGQMESEEKAYQRIYNEIELKFVMRENEELKRKVEEQQKKIIESEELMNRSTQKLRELSELAQRNGDSKLLEMIKVIAPFFGGQKFPDAIPNTPAQPMGEVPAVTMVSDDGKQSNSADKYETQIRELRKFYSEIEFSQAVEILDWLKDHREFIPHVSSWLLDQIEAKEKFLKENGFKK